MNISQVIRSLRDTKGISQLQLAEQLGCARHTVLKWEANRADPSLKALCKLADCFNLSTDQHLGRAPLPPAVPIKVGVRKVRHLGR